MPRHQNQVDFDPHTKPESLSTPTLKPSQFRSLHWNQATFDPPRKPSQFRPKHKNQANFDPHAKTNFVSIPRINPSPFWPPHQNQGNCDPYTEGKSSSIPSNGIKSISTTHTKTKPTSMFTLKPSDFPPAYKNQVNFGHPHKIGIQKPCEFRPPTQNRHTKSMWISTTHTKSKPSSMITQKHTW